VLVRDIAAMLGFSFEGDGERDIVTAAPLESAGPDALSFAGSAKAADAARSSGAGCVIATPSYTPSSGQTVIRSANPRASFAAVLSRLYPRRDVPAGVHPSAVIAPDAFVDARCSVGPHVTIGAGSVLSEGTVVGAGCAIGAKVKIGRGSLLHARVTIYDDVTIGARAILHSGCVIGADGFGFALVGDHYEKFPQVGRVEIGDDVEIGANACVDRAALGVTTISDGVKLDNMVHIGHNCRIGQARGDRRADRTLGWCCRRRLRGHRRAGGHRRQGSH
jgi:UDP-3-O-[3-hydroxymyristoyl] glucosamine N-acyltransferase